MTTRGSQATVEADAEGRIGAQGAAPEPGLLLVFAGGRPRCVSIPLGAEPIELGRDHPALRDAADKTMSRSHARVAYDGGTFHVADLGSRNGSALDGEPLHGTVATESARVLRLGQALLLLCPDLGPIQRLGVESRPGRVEGPALKSVLLSIARAAPLSRTLFIGGESGSGKEYLARAFHQAGPQRDGPLVAVNCAAIPEGIAERLLFGAVKGAYSGAAADSEGYVQAAHGGTLFLDEVGDLDAGVQAKLLRVLESGEVSPLGATRPRKVDVRFACATCKDLRALVAAGKFRADLYFRIGVPQVSVPPLRDRLEEIPWLVAAAAGTEVALHASLVEACLLRPWPGNVRELLAEINTALIAALGSSGGSVSAEHLRPAAGMALAPAQEDAAMPPSAQPAEPPDRARIIAALVEASGNVTAAARALGLHRTQLRRLLDRHAIDPSRVRGATRR
jgi:DNA-binding NtrC family response regulator